MVARGISIPETSHRIARVVRHGLLRELFRDEGFAAVVTLGRRSLPEAVAMARAAGRTLVGKLVPDMAPVSLTAATIEAVRDIDGDVEAFSVLGVGSGTSKLTIEEHRAVDVALNEAFARGTNRSRWNRSRKR